MTTAPDPAPLTEEELERIREAVDTTPGTGPALRWADEARLVTEVERLRAELAETRRVADHNNAAFLKAMDESAAENTALAAKLAAARAVPPKYDPDGEMPEAYVDGWNDAVRRVDAAAALGETGGTDAR